jgi:uncharacterized protein
VANGSTILTLSNGTGIDLLHPKATDIDFAVIAEHLSKEKRYNGATLGLEYSVAEHSVRGAHAILEVTKDKELAAYFLLHDAHEAFLKDDTTPKKRAIAAVAEESFGLLASAIIASFDLLTDRFDVAIHEAAGLPWPPPAHLVPLIKHWDLVMFVTEWRDLMAGIEHPNWKPYANFQPLKDRITNPWFWNEARYHFMMLARELLPRVGSENEGQEISHKHFDERMNQTTKDMPKYPGKNASIVGDTRTHFPDGHFESRFTRDGKDAP